MRISAKEAQDIANRVTSNEACLSGIFQRIKEAAEAGCHFVRIYDDMPKEPAFYNLFTKESLTYVSSILRELGYDVDTSNTCLKVNW